MPSCIVQGCHHHTARKSSNPEVILHGFPRSLSRIKQWLKQTGQNFGNLDTFAQRVLDGKKNNSFRICSTHFSPDSYVCLGSTKALRADAVPTLFAWNTPQLAQEKRGTCPPSKRGRLDSEHYAADPTACKCTRRKMVDASTLTDPKMFRVDKAMQWPEFEFNTDGEPWKVQHDHFYHTDSSSGKRAQKSAVDTDHQKDQFDFSNIIVLPEPIDSSSTRTHQAFPQEDSFHSSPSEVLETDPFVDFTLPSHKSRNEDTDDLLNGPDNTDPSTSLEHEAANTDVINERKFIVFESCIDVLLLKLPCGFGSDCSAPIIELEKHVDGSFLSVIGHCYKGHRFPLWDSQPVKGNVALGDLLTSAAVLFSGSNFQRVEEMSQLLGLQLFSQNTYYKFQQMYLFPTIDKHWQQERMYLRDYFKGKKLCLAGDGHCSKYYTYSFIDVDTKKVVDFQVIRLSEAATSLATEKLAFEICLDRILDEQFLVGTITTDRHPGIKELMREKYCQLDQKYDICHYAKHLRKRLLAVNKKRRCSQIKKWIPTITNHLMWCTGTSHGDAELLREKWQSLLLHLTDQHEWDGAKVYHACSHRTIKSRDRHLLPWIKKWSRDYHILREVVLSSQVIKDLHRLSPFQHSEKIKLYHRFIRKYRPDQIKFSMDAVEARTKLAALAHNASVHREHAPIRCQKKLKGAVGAQGHKLGFPKRTKNCQAKPVCKPTTNSHVVPMMSDVLKLCTGNMSHNCQFWAAPFLDSMLTEPKAKKKLGIAKRILRSSKRN